MDALLDARRLKLIWRWPTPGRRHAQSIYRHHHDAQECLCRWPHGNCNDFPCACPRHDGEIH